MPCRPLLYMGDGFRVVLEDADLKMTRPPHMTRKVLFEHVHDRLLQFSQRVFGNV